MRVCGGVFGLELTEIKTSGWQGSTVEGNLNNFSFSSC